MTEQGGDRPNDLNARDVELAQRIARTLDDSAEVFDADTRAQLTMSRHRALSRSRRQRLAGAIALAASILAVIATPWMLRQQAQDKNVEDIAYLSVDPDMLADMDMLLAIGEAQ